MGHDCLMEHQMVHCLGRNFHLEIHLVRHLVRHWVRQMDLYWES